MIYNNIYNVKNPVRNSVRISQLKILVSQNILGRFVYDYKNKT